MQKKIIALAVAAAFSAPAFADTTVYGVVDAAIANVSATGQKSDLLAVSGGLSSSRIGFKSVEDLSNGMKVVAVLEYGLDTQTSNNAPVKSTSNSTSTSTSTSNSTCGVTAGSCTVTTTTTTNTATTTTTTSGNATNIAARQQMLALAGDFGTIATGYLQTTGYDFGGKFDPTAGSTVSPLGNVTKGGGFLIGSVAGLARAQRALAYISPDLGGVTVAVNYTTSFDNALGNLTLPTGTVAGLKTTGYLVSANYAAGPVAAGMVYTAVSNASVGSNDVKEWAMGGSYDLGVAKLFATYQSQKVQNAAGSDKAMSFSAVAPVGPGAVIFSYAKDTIGSTVGVDDNGSGYTVAYAQGLSKMTTAYVAISKMKNGNGGSAYSVFNDGVAAGFTANGGSSTLIAAGLNKKF